MKTRQKEIKNGFTSIFIQNIPIDVKRAFKMFCAAKGTSMQCEINHLLSMVVRKQPPRKIK